MSYLLLLVTGWFLPLSDLGHPQYTIREAATKRAATWGVFALPALEHEVAYPHTAESGQRAERLLQKLPTLPGVLTRLVLSGGHRTLSDATMAHLAPWVHLRLTASGLIPSYMDWEWVVTGGGSCYGGPSPDATEFYTAFAIRLAIDTAFTTRVLKWYGFWSPEASN